MASTCKYCGADTWGRYQLCPDCRKERKQGGVYRSSHNTLGGEINSGSRYFCKSCQYRWESRKKYGAPAFCPKCSSESIIPFEETPEGKEELARDEADRKLMLVKEDKETKGFMILSIIFILSLIGLYVYLRLNGLNFGEAIVWCIPATVPLAIFFGLIYKLIYL